MLGSFLNKLYRQAVLLVIVALVLLAAYVSIGRQFMPAISGYSAFLEEQIFEATGVPVTVNSIAGSFTDFNPTISIDGLSLLVGESVSDGSIDPTQSALVFDRASIIVDMPRSLWQRQWVLEEFTVYGLEVEIVQQADGSWQIGGIGSGGAGTADLETVFRVLQRVSRLDLNQVAINVRNRSGDRIEFGNGSATIQNRGQNHFLHVNSTLNENEQELVFSLEVTGNRVERLNGQLHAVIPPADYSNVLGGIGVGEVTLQAVSGGAEFWVGLTAGRASSVVGELQLDRLALAHPETGPLQLDNLRGRSALSRLDNSEGWQGRFVDMSISSGEQHWSPFNASFTYRPENALQAYIDTIDLGFLTQSTLRSGLLDAAGREQLEAYSPAGFVRNLSLTLPLGVDSEVGLKVKGNVAELELGSRNGSPNMWGIDAYLEMERPAGSAITRGFAEVDSERFSINLPSVFTSVWDYGHVNGRLDFEIDQRNGQKVTLSSNVIEVESEAVDGHTRFTSVIERLPDGSRDAELELLVGATRFDAARKSLYLPDGPGVQGGLRETMSYLERAIVDGLVSNSGVLFRGKTHPGSGRNSKTFQSFYVVEDGKFDFSAEWPELEQITALVKTDDNAVDVWASQASSLDLRLASSTGQLRQDSDGKTWLEVNAEASGSTSAALDYLRVAPVGENLKSAFADWEASGGLSADLALRLPLGQETASEAIRLEIELEDNDLRIPEYEISLTDLSGPIVFDSETGLEESELQGQFLDGQVNIGLSSERLDDGAIETIYVDSRGSTTTRSLIDWPRQSGFVRDLLRATEGRLDYRARLSLSQGESDAANTLLIESNLRGVALDLPAPFSKQAASEMPVALNFTFGESEQTLTGSLGSDLELNLTLSDQTIADGYIQVGQAGNNLAATVGEQTDGLVILGDLERFEVEQWAALLDRMNSVDNPAADFKDAIAYADVRVDTFSIFGSELANLAFRVQPDAGLQAWRSRVTGEMLEGSITIPYNREDYLLFDLARLHLPQPSLENVPADDAGEPVPFDAERDDPLLNVDPRDLPPMAFLTESFKLGEREFGSWQFRLTPTAQGAEFDNLDINFRGLELGMEAVRDSIEQLEPHFSWYFDGEDHSSHLQGVITAGNIADVLLANGFAASLVSDRAVFVTDLSWPGSPASLNAASLDGRLELLIENGRFLQDTGATGALKLVSILNFSAIMRRLRFSDDLLRRGLAFDEISGELELQDGVVDIQDHLVISGPSSLYQITGEVDLAEETIDGELYVTLPVSDNIPWLGLLTANIPLAVGAYLFDQIFGDQVDSLTSAVYTLQGPWDDLQPEFKQAFGSPDDAEPADTGNSPQ